MRSTTMRLSAFGKFFIAIVLCGSVIIAFACDRSHRKPCRYLIPHGYVGWVLIELNVVGARPPGREAGYITFKIPASGRIGIPGSAEIGWARDEYYYVDGQGKRELLSVTSSGGGGMIWGEGASSVEQIGGTKFRAEHFFVGKEEEFDKAQKLDELILQGTVKR